MARYANCRLRIQFVIDGNYLMSTSIFSVCLNEWEETYLNFNKNRNLKEGNVEKGGRLLRYSEVMTRSAQSILVENGETLTTRPELQEVKAWQSRTWTKVLIRNGVTCAEGLDRRSV